MPPLLLTCSEAAAMLRYSADYVRQLCRAGVIRAVRIGCNGRAGNWRIERASLEAFAGITVSGERHRDRRRLRAEAARERAFIKSSIATKGLTHVNHN